jgi:hypothetical protein
MKKIIAFLALFSSLLCAQFNEVLQGVSIFVPRSQSVNAVRYEVGWHPYIHRADYDNWYAAFAITPEFTKSFHPDHIAEALFGTDTLFITGSQVDSRGPNDILADYFGLSTTFRSCVLLEPKIKNFISTFSLYVGFDGWIPGLYFMIHAPAVWTLWHFKMDETVFDSGVETPYPAQYMAADEVTAPYRSFMEALSGTKTFGQMTEPLAAGKVCCNGQSKGGLSDLILVLGYDIVSRPGGYAGLNLRCAAPTGSRPDGTFLFEPLIGNGKHWEFGVGFSGRVLVWEKDGEQELSLFADLNFTHLFKSCQRRSFDLCENGFGSRYILLKQFDSDGNYAGTLLPAINVTTLSCDVRIDLQFEFLAMLGYTYNGLVFDIGYNGWIRSKERITLNECIPNHTYGLKGIQNVVTDLGQLSPITQSTATLHGNFFADMAAVADPDSPRFIRTSDINVRSAASPMLLTHKIFAYLGYGFESSDSDWYVPYLGIGTSIEFEGINTSNTEKPNRNTLSQWALWAKGGFAFG